MTPAQLKDLYARKAGAMAKRPDFARASGYTRVRLRDGFLCEAVEPDGTVHADVPPEDGGSGRAPDPGALVRAGLGASLAMGYRLWAARLDVAIDGVEVEVFCEYDARGQFGVNDDVPVSWQRLVVAVSLTSAALDADLRRVVETANHRSPVLALLAPHIAQVHQLTVVRPARNGSFPAK